MRIIGAGKVEMTALEKCNKVLAAVTGRRKLSIREALKKFQLSSGVYYR